MNPDDRPRTLLPARVEWVPSSPDEIEVRVFGTWHGPTVPPPAALLLHGEQIAELGPPPGDDVPPAWSAAFLVPVELRSAVEAGDASLDVGGLVVGLPPAAPGRMTAPASDIGTLVDPAVLAERRARRAEIAEQSAAERAASAEQEASTLRAQLDHLEERLGRAAEERDSLASRVADAERRLRLTEQREEAERRRRGELEEELAAERRSVEQEVRDLSDRLASAEEITASLERELVAVRRREEAERAAREHVDEQLRVALERASALEGAAADEGEELRRRAAILADRLAEAEAERVRLEAVGAELDVVRARLAGAESTADDVADLRRRLAEAEAERDALTAQLEGVPEIDGDEVDALRAEVAELRRRLDETLAALEHERREHAATEHARRLAVERTREAREAAGARGDEGPSARESELAEQVAALQAEIAGRAATHRRVQQAIETVRSELGRVREQLLESRRASAPEVDALNERVRLLEDLVRRRDEELEITRMALTDAERAAEEARSASSATADALRAGFESRVGELSAAVAQMRERLRDTTSDFERRLADERVRREAAEAALDALRTAPPAPPVATERPAAPDTPREPRAAPAGPAADPAGDDALEALIAALREQVESARDPLSTGDESDVSPPAGPDVPPAAEATRERLQAIEGELRAAVPDPDASASAREVIASLQHAAERLRAAAAAELAQIGSEEPPGAEGARVEDVGAPAAPADEAAEPARVGTPPPGDAPAAVPEPASAPLGSRPVDFGAAETPWLRTAIERMAQSEPARAADLLVALLPSQAMTGVDLTYVLTAPTLGAVRVALASGTAEIERAPASLDAAARISGSLATLAPLAAGGGGRWVKGVRIEGAKRPAKKLLRRRRPVGLGDFALVTPPPEPELILAALAAAVEPWWTRGHRFGVTYEIGAERWTVVASDGDPLAVRDAGEPHAVTVTVAREALLPVLQGAASAATVTGDRRAADVLHAWFDRARGVAAG